MEEIDVRPMLRDKNPRIAALVPPVALRGLELAAHQRELRAFIREAAGCHGCEFVERALKRLHITVALDGEENLPPSPHFVMCANHPTGGIDGLVLMHLLCRRYGGVRVPANDLLSGLSGLSELLVPINKYGSNRDRVVRLTEAYAVPLPLLVFPAGRTARLRGGAVFRGALREYPWNKAFLKLARRSHRTIVPVGISGRNSARFYAIWKMRRVFGVNLNLEMLLLMDELMRQRGSTRRVVIAPPIEPEALPDDVVGAQQIRYLVERLAVSANGAAGRDRLREKERVPCP